MLVHLVYRVIDKSHMHEIQADFQSKCSANLLMAIIVSLLMVKSVC